MADTVEDQMGILRRPDLPPSIEPAAPTPDPTLVYKSSSADDVKEHMGLSPAPSIESTAPPSSPLAYRSLFTDPIHTSTVANFRSARDIAAPSSSPLAYGSPFMDPIHTLTVANFRSARDVAAPSSSPLAYGSPFTDPVHTSTVTNSRSTRDIVSIISLGQKTDALLDRLGIEDHFILHLRDLVGNVRSSKWSATLTSPEWGLSSDSAGDLYDALMEDLALIDKTISLRLSAISFHPLMPLNSQEHQSKTNLSSQSLLVERSATARREVIDFLLLWNNANIYYNGRN